jgi:hypothetical protein
VADPSLTVAACIHAFGWSATDWNRLAGATVAGHLIECGTQVTGGISTDWLEVPAPDRLGFPIVEVFEDGSCIVSKTAGSGGRVDLPTLKEQLLYEIGDPTAYVSPDVTVSFTALQLENLGDDRVRVSGAAGAPPPPTYKVSATYRDGYRAAGTLTIFGREAVAKARRCGELVLQRLRAAGCEWRESVIECLGTGECARRATRTTGAGQPELRETVLRETVLRIALESDQYETAERFSRELMPLITAGPQGTTGYAEGRPRVHPVYRYWPCLIDRRLVTPHSEILVSPSSPSSAGEWPVRGGRRLSQELPHTLEARPTSPTTLFDLAHARSGDKGIHANIGVLARDPRNWPFLQQWLTAERVASYFASPDLTSVERFELPNLHALNFVLRGILRNSLRSDAQGKALASALLELPLPSGLDELT